MLLELLNKHKQEPITEAKRDLYMMRESGRKVNNHYYSRSFALQKWHVA